jgi:hypothetical protein
MATPIKTKPTTEQDNAPVSKLTDKKLWFNPELILISVADVTSKNHPAAREATGQQGTPGGNNSSIFFTGAFIGGFIGTKYQAIS